MHNTEIKFIFLNTEPLIVNIVGFCFTAICHSLIILFDFFFLIFSFFLLFSFFYLLYIIAWFTTLFDRTVPPIDYLQKPVLPPKCLAADHSVRMPFWRGTNQPEIQQGAEEMSHQKPAAYQ